MGNIFGCIRVRVCLNGGPATEKLLSGTLQTTMPGGGREGRLDNLTLATKYTGIEVTYFTVAQTHWPELVTWPHQTTTELKMKSYSGWKWELLMNSNYINESTSQTGCF